MLACQTPSLFCRLQTHEDFCQPAALHITGENYEGGELKGLGLIKVTVIYFFFKEELKAARPVLGHFLHLRRKPLLSERAEILWRALSEVSWALGIAVHACRV